VIESRFSTMRSLILSLAIFWSCPFSNAQTIVSDWVSNGAASYAGNALHLTSSQTYQTGSAFSSTQVRVDWPFNVLFNFYMRSPSDPAGMGLTFMVQKDVRGTSALGAWSGSLGYAGSLPYAPWSQTDTNVQHSPITPSVAMRLMTNSNGSTLSTVGFATNGVFTTAAGEYDVSASYDFSSGNLFSLNITYLIDSNNQGTLYATVTDTVSGLKTQITPYNINIYPQLGSRLALLGFSAGTGFYFEGCYVRDIVYTSLYGGAPSISASPTPSNTPTSSMTPSNTPSVTSSASPTSSFGSSPSNSPTSSYTATMTRSATPSSVGTITPTMTSTSTPSATQTPSNVATVTPTMTIPIKVNNTLVIVVDNSLSQAASGLAIGSFVLSALILLILILVGLWLIRSTIKSFFDSCCHRKPQTLVHDASLVKILGVNPLYLDKHPDLPDEPSQRIPSSESKNDINFKTAFPTSSVSAITEASLDGALHAENPLHRSAPSPEVEKPEKHGPSIEKGAAFPNMLTPVEFENVNPALASASKSNNKISMDEAFPTSAHASVDVDEVNPMQHSV
jgi:Bacterial lectin